MRLLQARIWTADAGRPWARGLVVSGRRVAALGEPEELRSAYPRAEVLDLPGALVIPGLWDAHIHFYYWCLSHRQVELAGSRSLGEILARVGAWMQVHPGWITGWGWNETAWDPPRMPTRAQLDPVTGTRPAVLWRSDMHSALVNTAALEIAGLLEKGVDVEGGVIDRFPDGAPTGLLRELAIGRVRACVPEPDQETVLDALRGGARLLHRHGVTALCDQRMKSYTEGPRAFAALESLDREGQLRLRVHCNLAAHDLDRALDLGLRTGFGSDRLRVGHVKFFLDGTLGSRTAWMLDPFEEAGTGELANRGMAVTDPQELARDVARAHRGGLSVSVHAIGTRANRECLGIFEQLEGRPDIPHRIEHVQFIAPEDLGRLARAGVTASLQPAHILDDMDTVDAYLGSRGSCAYRLASLQRAGTLLAFGSDAPVADFDPFYGIRGAVLRQRAGRSAPWYPEERLSLEETLRAYTLGAARAAGWEGIVGTLAPGKRADLVVLEPDPFREAADPAVRMTMFDGEIVYSRS